MNPTTVKQLESILTCMTINRGEGHTALNKASIAFARILDKKVKVLLASADHTRLYNDELHLSDTVTLHGLLTNNLDRFRGVLLIDNAALTALLRSALSDIKQADAENSSLARRNADLLQQYHNLKTKSDREASDSKKQLDEVNAELETMRLATISMLENHELQNSRTRAYIKHLESKAPCDPAPFRPPLSEMTPEGHIAQFRVNVTVTEP